MGYKEFADYSVHEVVIWVNAIGMDDRAQAFTDNDVDGRLLIDLTDDDMKTDLGFSGLQVKKFRQKLNFTLKLTAPRGGNGGGDGDARVVELESENEALKKELANLVAIKAALHTPAPAPAAPAPSSPASAPAPAKQAPPPQQHHHEVARGAAVGAAGGAAKGAIVGAILPGMSASDGAKAGAAVGALDGGVHGLRARRHR